MGRGLGLALGLGLGFGFGFGFGFGLGLPAAAVALPREHAAAVGGAVGERAAHVVQLLLLQRAALPPPLIRVRVRVRVKVRVRVTVSLASSTSISSLCSAVAKPSRRACVRVRGRVS